MLMCSPVLRIRTFLVGSGSGRLGPDPDPDFGLNKWPYSFFGVCKSHDTFGNSVSIWFMTIPFRAYFRKTKFRRNLAENLLRSGSGRFRKSDPDPVKNRPDPQHWCSHMLNHTVL
jgi:hypothetical protein